MFALMSPVALVLLSWLLLFLLFSGLGMIPLRLFGGGLRSGRDLYDSFWLGWALSLILLQVWHLAWPVNDLALLLLAMLAALGLMSRRDQIRALAGRLPRNAGFLALLIPLLLWLALRAIEMPVAYDSGYRDFQAVMWIDSYAIVPGLNNLFSSFAYNHSVYLYDALLDVSIWSGRAHHIATGLLIAAYLLYPLKALATLHRGCPRWSAIFAALTIPCVFYYSVGRGGISHFLTDTPVDLLGLLLLIHLLDILQCYRAGGRDDYRILRLALLIVAGFTIKQTFWVFGLSVAGAVAILWLRRSGGDAMMRRAARIGLPIAGLALAAMLPWMLRGVVTSGYIAYPQSIGRVNVEWAEPLDMMQHRQQRLATNTRRRYGDASQVLSSWDWVGPWFAGFKDDVAAFTLPAAITVIALSFCGLGRALQPAGDNQASLSVLALLPLLIALAVWFFSFPNIKYVRYILWGGAALSVLLALLAWPRSSWRWRLLCLYALIGLCFLWGLRLILSQEVIIMPAGPSGGFHEHALPPSKIYQTGSGLRVNVPDSHIPQCWRIPLPCTPYPRPGLYARVPGDLQHGFGYHDR